MEIKVRIVVDEDQAFLHIHSFQQEGYAMHQIHVLACDHEIHNGPDEVMITYQLSDKEQVTVPGFANLYRAKGQTLRKQMENFGLTEHEALQYEQALQYGGYLILAKSDPSPDYYDSDFEFENFAGNGSNRFNPVQEG